LGCGKPILIPVFLLNEEPASVNRKSDAEDVMARGFIPKADMCGA
jgi:hypothetical protein